jgi:hypothetical protein
MVECKNIVLKRNREAPRSRGHFSGSWAGDISEHRALGAEAESGQLIGPGGGLLGER